MSLFKMVAVAVLAAMFGGAAEAQTKIISAPQALESLQSEQIVMLDIRTPQEWKETGLAEGAWPVSMHRDDFVQHLRAILSVYRPDQIALICATGGRSAHIAKVLEGAGVPGILDVSESMLGNPRGPGWIERGLPIVSYADALADYEATMAAQGSN